MSYGDGGFWFTQPVTNGGYGAPMFNSYRSPMDIGFNGNVIGYAGASTGNTVSSLSNAILAMEKAKFILNEMTRVGAPTGSERASYQNAKSAVDSIRAALLKDMTLRSGNTSSSAAKTAMQKFVAALATFEAECHVVGAYSAELNLSKSLAAVSRYDHLYRTYLSKMGHEKIGSTARRTYEKIANAFLHLKHAAQHGDRALTQRVSAEMSKLSVVTRLVMEAGAAYQQAVASGSSSGTSASRASSRTTSSGASGGTSSDLVIHGGVNKRKLASTGRITSTSDSSVMGPQQTSTAAETAVATSDVATSAQANATVDAAIASSQGISGFVTSNIGKIVGIAGLVGTAYLIWQNREKIKKMGA